MHINTSEKTVKFNDKVVKLGPKEFKILLLLIERPGHVFSRSLILDKVWGHGNFVGERTVDVHIARLKKTLAEASTDSMVKNLLRTVRGEGYSLSKD